MIHARILIVEDESILAADLKQTLERMGHTVVGVCANGAEALRLAVDMVPDLVLMDINIQGALDGIETASALRESALATPVIFLTSYSDVETLARARVAEPFGYLLKPFDEQLLAIAIEMAVYKNRAERERERLRRELAESKEEIRTLSGLLPICCHCKKIRNDSGYWEQIDSYMSRHSVAQFSHGICLDCFSTRHPEILAKILADTPDGGAGI